MTRSFTILPLHLTALACTTDLSYSNSMSTSQPKIHEIKDHFEPGSLSFDKLQATLYIIIRRNQFSFSCSSSSNPPSHPIIPPNIYWEIPMTPQAGRAPALPVFLLSSFSPLPRSSVPAWTTTVRPRTLSGPISLMNLSETVPSALPWASVLKLPRSPTWRSLSEGAPWVLLWGLTG